MTERIPLPSHTELRFTNHDGGRVSYMTTDVVGMGGVCIVYDGYYLNNDGSGKKVRIKECCPHQLHMMRQGSGALVPGDGEQSSFEAYKERVRRSFAVSNELYQSAGLTNSVSNMLDIYEENHTVYIVSSYVEGDILADRRPESLLDAVKLVCSVAKSMDQIHQRGYLYLDLKPENILMLPETVELVQLFDFDTMIPVDAGEHMGDYRISYSPGYAPLEQKTGNLARIGVWSDVYSVGALLFSLVFGRVPRAWDCGGEAAYDYEKMAWPGSYQDRLYQEMTAFFQHTLQSFPKDRYQSMGEAVAQLTLIAQYADRTVPYLLSSRIPEQELVIGRKQELSELSDWFFSDSSVIFVSGMGGIGKSTLVREFLREHREWMDHMLYLYFNGSVCDTITDDRQLAVNQCQKDPEENQREYFKRKGKLIRGLVHDKTTVVVIDNFDGELTDDFLELIREEWKVVAVTRRDMAGCGCRQLRVEAFHSQEALRQLFFIKSGYALKNTEIRKLDCLIEMAAGHTLILELIARQMARSYLTLDEALSLVKQNGFAGIAPEKVELFKDGRKYNAKITAILKAVYDLQGMTDEKRKILKVLSWFDGSGMELQKLKALLQLPAYDAVHELREEGWLQIWEGNAGLHPLVREVSAQTEWNGEYRGLAAKEMKILTGAIRLPEAEKDGDLSRKLRMAKALLGSCRSDKKLSSSGYYQELMFALLIHMPREQEAYILKQADILLQAPFNGNSCDRMELYDYIVFLYCQRKDFESAGNGLLSAYQFAERQSEAHIWGLYFEMQADFYEAVLSAAEEAVLSTAEEAALSTAEEAVLSTANGSGEKAKLFAKMQAANDKAIRYMRKSTHENAKRLLAKYLLGKAIMLIRSGTAKRAENESLQLMAQAKAALRQDPWKDQEMRAVYYMTRAWYYTLCKPDIEKVFHNLQKAGALYRNGKRDGLESIDYYMIPAANMMCELDETARGIAYLEKGIKYCDGHPDSIPYIRKKIELLEYQRQVYYNIGDEIGCRRISLLIEESEAELGEI